MAIVALIMRPWIMLMRTISGIQRYILADDVLIVATGKHMAANFVKALNTTHLFLQHMGAKVAPDKSYNFASHPKAREWIVATKWDHVAESIAVVTDFRYLGAHLTTKHTTTSATLDDRLNKANSQLNRLRFCQAGVQAKVRAILGKVYAAGLYGAEAARITPSKFAKLSAAVINVFRSRNDNHNADRFYTTVGACKDDIEPVAQVFCRRAMQIRRTAYKQRGAEERFKRLLLKYASKCKHKTGKWPRWFHRRGEEEEEDRDDHHFPTEQPHPPTNDHQPD